MTSRSRSALVALLDEGEARHRLAVHRDALLEHLARPHPPALGRAVDRAVDDQLFLGLGVLGDAEHRVFLAFVVAVAARDGHASRTQVSLVPPPWEEFTTREP